MTAKARSAVAVIAGMAAAGITTHLLGTYLHLSPLPKSAILLLAAGGVTAIVLYLTSRGAD